MSHADQLSHPPSLLLSVCPLTSSYRPVLSSERAHYMNSNCRSINVTSGHLLQEGKIPRLTGRLTVGRNVTLTLTSAGQLKHKRLKLGGGQAYDRSSV
jgi:hypothetical protein